MRSGTVSNKFIYSQMRLDGSFHLSEGLSVRKSIESCPSGVIHISDVTKDVYCPGIFRRNYVSSGIPFLGGGDIQKQELDSGKFLRKSTTPNYEILQVERGWSLVTCGGTIGDTVFSTSLHSKCWLSQHVMRVIPNENITQGMLYAYLASKYGKLLLTTDTYGSVIPTLNAASIKNLPIPQFSELFQQRIDSLIKEYAQNRENAEETRLKAIEVLNSFIAAPFTKHGFMTGHVGIKDILSSLQERLDPPALINDGVVSMADIISKRPFKRIGQINATVHRPGIFKRCYVNDGIPYIKGSEVFMMNPFRRCEHLSRTKTPFVDEMALHEGQILITCAGSVGNIKMITKEYQDKKAIGSQDIIRLVSHDELYTKEYLFTYLQLPFVYDYIQSMKYGSVIERIEPFHVESIPVIEPSKEISQQITTLIQQYMDYTYHAFNAEETAINLVEHEIESWNS